MALVAGLGLGVDGVALRGFGDPAKAFLVMDQRLLTRSRYST